MIQQQLVFSSQQGTASQCPRYRDWATSSLAPIGPWLGRGPAFTSPQKPQAGPCFDPASRYRFRSEKPRGCYTKNKKTPP
jgi:hypothetical protein